MTSANDKNTQRLFSRWNNDADSICILASDGRAFSRAQIAALGAPVTDLADKGPALVFIEGRNTPAFIAAYVAAMRSGLAVHVLDPARRDENARLANAFHPLAIIRTAQDNLLVQLSGKASSIVHPDLALLLPTSGTTGSSKMARISTRAITANTAAIIEYLQIGPNDCAITTLKPFYSFGLTVINSHLDAGGKVALNDAGIESPEFWERACARAVTNLAGVPHTFELLATMLPRLDTLSELRFMAQAGGRLAPRLVQQFAQWSARAGWRFFVMYGQTEASPRMSYLPPELAAAFPNSIGVAIPGGRLWIADENGEPVDLPGVEGELHYVGPNVMSGYASTADDLANLDSITDLATGDLARRLENGLFVVTGRRSRFVKPFGLRISLDSVEDILTEAGITAAATALDDHIVVLMADAAQAPSPQSVRRMLAERMRLPAALIDVRLIDVVPLLASEKIDRRAVAAIAAGEGPLRSTLANDRNGMLHLVWQEFRAILHGTSTTANCVLDIFLDEFGDRVHEAQDSFIGLGGDSMSAVTFAIRLEDMLGNLPETWPSLTIAQLELLRKDKLV